MPNGAHNAPRDYFRWMMTKEPSSQANKMRPQNYTEAPLRILVRSDMVGAIIGRSGGTIKQITLQTKARIDVHREESVEHHEKVITISGEPDNCSEACFKILEVIQNELQGNRDNSSNNNMNYMHDNEVYSESKVQLKILAHNNLIGRLIGKGGASIKKIMEQTSTKINISMKSLADTSQEHTITVVGNLEQVRQAERIISTKLRIAYMTDVNTALQTMNPQPYLFNNTARNPYMPNPYTSTILPSMVNTQNGLNGKAISRPVPMSSHQAQLAGSLYPSSSGYLPLYPNLATTVPPSGPALLGFNPMVTGAELERETVNLYVPNNMVGAIIGISGSAIKEMISSSGASIKVATLPTTVQEQESNRATKNNDSTDANELQKADSREHGSEETNESYGANEHPSHDASNNNREHRHQATNSKDYQGSFRKVTIVGYPDSQYTAQYLIYRKVSIEDGKNYVSLLVEIQVPSQCVGRIIGKGGVTIKNMQKQTRTTIRLADDKSNSSQDNPENGEACIQIIGEFQGSQIAQRQIRSLIRDTTYSYTARQSKLNQNNWNSEINTYKTNAQVISTDNNNQIRSDTVDDTSAIGKAESVADRSNENNSEIDENQSEVNPTKKESPNICNDNNGLHLEDKSQTVGQCSPDDHQTDHDNTVVTNNNTLNNNLNTSEQSIDKQSNVNSKDDLNVNDLKEIDGHDSCLESKTTSCAQNSTNIESSRTEAALVNNGNQ